MLKAVNLTKKFDDLVAVDHINAEIKSGSVFGLIGTNGAGKSTFLRLAAGGIPRSRWRPCDHRRRRGI